MAKNTNIPTKCPDRCPRDNTETWIPAPPTRARTGQPGQPGQAPRATPSVSTVTQAATKALEAVLEQSRVVNQLVETIQHQNTQPQVIQDHEEDAEMEKKMLKVRENILFSTIEPFNAKRPGEWITSVQKRLQTHRLVWLEESEEDQLTEPGITHKVHEMLDSAVTLVAEKAVTLDAKVLLGVHHKSYHIAQLLEEYTDVYMDKSATPQEELWLIATKIKMRRKRSIIDYITKHQILRNDMIDANCTEIIQDESEARKVE